METVKEIGQFVGAVINNWAGYSTGGIIVAAVAFWRALRNIPVSQKVLLTLAAVFFVIALFKA